MHAGGRLLACDGGRARVPRDRPSPNATRCWAGMRAVRASGGSEIREPHGATTEPDCEEPAMRRRDLKQSVLARASCAADPASRGGADGKLTIAVIPKGTTHVFWQRIHAGAEKAAQELGVTVIWRGPLREDDRASQISEVEGFITRGVSGIALAPLDEAALVAAGGRRAAPEDPGRHLRLGAEGRDYVSFVATDNRQGRPDGRRAPREALNGKGKVVLLRYAEGHDSTTQREEGFLEAIAAHKGIEVVSSNQYGGADVEGASSAARRCSATTARRRQPRHRRHLLRQRVDDVRVDARAAGQRLGGQGEVRRLRRVRQPGQGAGRRAHRRAGHPGPGQDGLPRREDAGRRTSRASRSRSGSTPACTSPPART